MPSLVQFTIVNVGLRFPESPNTAILCVSGICSGLADALTNDNVIVPRGYAGDPYHGMALRQVEALRQWVICRVNLSVIIR